jgi:hypothetical protein
MFVPVSKAAIRHWRIEGSNPSPSAQPRGAPREGAPLLACGGFGDRNVQSVEVQARPQESVGLRVDWRTTGERIRHESARFRELGASLEASTSSEIDRLRHIRANGIARPDIATDPWAPRGRTTEDILEAEIVLLGFARATPRRRRRAGLGWDAEREAGVVLHIVSAHAVAGASPDRDRRHPRGGAGPKYHELEAALDQAACYGSRQVPHAEHDTRAGRRRALLAVPVVELG